MQPKGWTPWPWRFKGSAAASTAPSSRPLAILRSRFASDDKTEGYRKDGPVSVARFELVKAMSLSSGARILRQRQACDVIEQLLARIGMVN